MVKVNEKVDERFATAAMMGDLAIRFTDDPAADEFWAESHKWPHAQVIGVSGHSVICVGPKPMGDQVPANPVGAMYVGKRDARTYVISDNLERLTRMIEHAGGQPEEDKSLLWNSLDGGLATAFGDRQSTQFGLYFLATVLQNNAIDVEQVLTDLQNDMTMFGFGLDLDPQSGEVVLKMKATCADVAAAKRVSNGFAALQGLARAQLVAISQSLDDPQQTAELADGERAALDAHRCWTQLLADARLEMKPATGEVVEIQIDASAPFPQKLALAFRPASEPLYYRPAAEGEIRPAGEVVPPTPRR